MKLKLDCRHYRNDKPCGFACRCEGCAHYAPMGTRILIVKLDAVGDVARTTAVLKPLREKYGPCHITWLVYPSGEQLLTNNPEIDVLLAYRPDGLERLRVERFDVAICFDKTPRAAAVMAQIHAGEKLGFSLSEYGTVYPLTPEAEYALQLGFDDDLKFRRNAKTYQQIIFEMIGLEFTGQDYCLSVDDAEREQAAAMLTERGIEDGDRVIGLNLGGSAAFANKMWGADVAIAFLELLAQEVPCKTLLFGAKLEEAKIGRILNAGLPNVFEAMTPHNCRVFQALLGRCAVVVTGDSLGMHLALAAGRPIVALFGPTCAQEIELYGRGEKLVSSYDCVPCYCSGCCRLPSCADSITPRQTLDAVKRWLPSV